MLETNPVRCMHTARGLPRLYSRIRPCERSNYHVCITERLALNFEEGFFPITCKETCLLGSFYYSAVDPLPDTSATVPDLFNENIRLRARIEQLEALVAINKTEVPNPMSTSSVNDTPSNSQPPEDIVTTFEELSLGDSVKAWPEDSQNRSRDSPQHIMSLLPIRQSSLTIVRFSLATLGWVHRALNGPRFLAEHDAFWNALESNNKNAFENHGWMSVYFSVLAVSHIWKTKTVYLMLTIQGWGVLPRRRSCRRHTLHPRRLLWATSSSNGVFHQWIDGHFSYLVRCSFQGTKPCQIFQQASVIHSSDLSDTHDPASKLWRVSPRVFFAWSCYQCC